jgi:hypothetical protein
MAIIFFVFGTADWHDPTAFRTEGNSTGHQPLRLLGLKFQRYREPSRLAHALHPE